MSVRRKRALLAGIEGQLAAMNGDASTQRRWQRISRSLNVLRALPCDAFETARLAQLQRQIAAMLKMAGRHGAWLIAQRRTLARADCIIWQMYLRRHDAAPASSVGLQWPPRAWPVDDASHLDHAVGAAVR